MPGAIIQHAQLPTRELYCCLLRTNQLSHADSPKLVRAHQKAPHGQKEIQEPASQSYYISDAILLLSPIGQQRFGDDFTFSSNDNVYEVSFETNQIKLKDGSMLPEYEMSVCVSMKPGNVFYRLYRAAKYLSGYCSCYGDFDSFEFTQTDAEKLHLIVSGLSTHRAVH